MTSDNPFMDDYEPETRKPVKPHHELKAQSSSSSNQNDIIDTDHDGIDDNANILIGAIMNIGREKDMHELKRQDIDSDMLMEIFTDGDEDDYGTDYDGDGSNNDLTGEPDGE